MKLSKKPKNIFQYIFIVVGFIAAMFFVFIVLGNIYYDKINPPTEEVSLGVSFSQSYAKSLNLDWKKTYLSLFNDLGVKKIRLNSYWTDTEPTPGYYFFSELDFMLDEATKHDAKVLLVIGAKQPLWPECHIPLWAKQLPLNERRLKTLDLIQTVVEKYKNHPAIWGWQVENEPLFDYGAECDPADRQFLKSEVSLVKRLDPSRPIIISDSGELRLWRTPMQLSDIFGTTLYRSVYNPIFGYFYWPLPPAAYRLKSDLVRKIFAQNNDKTIIVELQTEPWLPKFATQIPIDQQVKTFSSNDLINNVNYAKRTGFDEVYLWGAEWWYFMNNNNNPQYLESAKQIFKR